MIDLGATERIVHECLLTFCNWWFAMQNLVFPIDDILLPAAVTITLHDALQGFCPGNGKMRDSVRPSTLCLGMAGRIQDALLVSVAFS